MNPEQMANYSDEQLAAEIRKNPKGTPQGDLLRYERYQRSGGKLSRTEWYPRSRGSRRGGPEHRQKQDALVLEGQNQWGGAQAEYLVLSTERFVDVYWPNGPNKKPVYHQIGALNQRGDPINRERQVISELVSELNEMYGKTNYELWFWDKTDPNAPPLINPHTRPEWHPPRIIF